VKWMGRSTPELELKRRIVESRPPESSSRLRLEQTEMARVLIIDDQPAARVWARRALDGQFVCFDTGSVQEFFELAARELPDVILADLEMVPLSGIKLCQLAKATPALASVPFVLLTAHETAEAKVASLTDGADDHLPKSITARELVGRVRALVRMRRAMLHAANLEALVEQRTGELRAVNARLEAEITRRERVEAELRLAQKLEAVGQLAAGVAHEINTPIQYIGDSVHFLHESFSETMAACERMRALLRGLDPARGQEQVEPELQAIDAEFDLPYLVQHAPQAFASTLEGVARVSAIVGALKALVHPGQAEKAAVNLHDALRSTLIVTRSAYRDVAEVETDFGELPLVECHVGELSQVFVNLIVNAAHAIADAAAESGARGVIRVRTRHDRGTVTVRIEDTGAGIPEAIRHRIFDPFFTTKPVGKGTGQGLCIANAIVSQHGGRLTFETEVRRGTAFTIELPVRAQAGSESQLSTANTP
jgi:signal transduction histidine kinase